MVEIKQDNKGINFLYEYYPKSIAQNCTFEVKNEHYDNILNFKNDIDDSLFERYTNELLEAIIQIAKDYSNSKTECIGLVAVPTSKVNKISPLNRVIEVISKMDPVILKEKYDINIPICDYSDFLKRIVDVPASHLLKGSERLTIEDHKKTIECTKSGISKLWANIIILDDITTTGTIMKTCKDKLVENGAKPIYTHCLALAKTTKKKINNEIIDESQYFNNDFSDDEIPF